MSEQLIALYELQNLDLKITKLNTRLAALDGAKDLKRKYFAAKATLESAEKTLKEHEAELKDSELKLKSIDEKRGNCEKRMYGGKIANPKELSALEKKIAGLKEQQGKLHPRVLELYELVDGARAKVESIRTVLQAAEAEARQALKQEAVEKAAIEAELAELNAKRAAEAAKFADRALLSKYDALRKRTGSSGIAKLIEGKCEGCHVGITSYTIHKLYTTDEIQACENCGRILMVDK
jgi:uncharacterized protein